MNDYLTTLITIVSGYKDELYQSFYDHHKNILNSVTSAYGDLKELLQKKYLLKSYLHKIELSLTEEDEEYIDSNYVKIKSLRNAIDVINENIRINEQIINDQSSFVESLDKFSIFKDMSENCIKVKYKYYECEMCYKEFTCSGHKKSRYRQKKLGYLCDLIIF